MENEIKISKKDYLLLYKEMQFYKENYEDLLKVYVTFTKEIGECFNEIEDRMENKKPDLHLCS